MAHSREASALATTTRWAPWKAGSQRPSSLLGATAAQQGAQTHIAGDADFKLAKLLCTLDLQVLEAVLSGKLCVATTLLEPSKSCWKLASTLSKHRVGAFSKVTPIRWLSTEPVVQQR